MVRWINDWRICGLLVLMMFGLGAVTGTLLVPPTAENKTSEISGVTDMSNPLQPAYVGSEVCARCHAEHAAAHAMTGHARTFLSEKLAERYSTLCTEPLNDPERSDHLKIECDQGKLVAVYEDATRATRLPIQFALGSGVHATTFVTLLDGDQGQPTLLEHRFTLFDHGEKRGLTPSHAGLPNRDVMDGLGKIHQGKDATNCIACHATTGMIRGRNLDDIRPNVSCESCHGPGRAHAAAREANLDDTSMRFAKGWSTALEEIQMCGKCHRLPEMMSSPVSNSDPKLTRFQPVGLLNSDCYRKSSERLKCSTCHDPHQTVDLVSENYSAKCRNCHSQAADGQKVCPKSSRDNCVSCHMPPVELHPGISFHDHWIRVRTEEPNTP